MLKKILSILLVICSVGYTLKAQCPAPGSAGGSDVTICSGSNATLGGTLPSGFTGTWSKMSFFDFETITSPSSPTSTVTNLNNLFLSSVSVIWTISNGSNCTNIKDTVTIIIANPPVSANAGADKMICLGETVNLSATVAPAGSSGVWSKLGGTNTSTSIITTPSSAFSTVTGLSLTGKDTLKWTVSNTACGAIVSDIIVITTNNVPSAAHAGIDKTGCVGDTLTLLGSIATSGSPVWSRAGQNILNSGDIRFVPNGNNDTVKVLPTVGGTYTLYYTISVGTANIHSTCTSQDTMIFTVNPGPVAHIVSPSNITACSIDTTFTLNANTPATGETGVWSVSNGTATLTPISSTSTKVSGLSKGTTTVVWTVTGTNGCSTRAKVNITIGASAGKDSTACVGGPFQLSGNINIGWSASWSMQASAGASINGNSASANASVSFQTTGTFHLFYSVFDPATGCHSTDTMNVTAVVCLGTGIANNETVSSTLSVYPNPTEGIFLVSLKDDQASYTEISVLGPDGRVVLQEQLGSIQNIQKEINLSDVAKGVYFVRVKKGEKTSYAKLVIQ